MPSKQSTLCPVGNRRAGVSPRRAPGERRSAGVIWYDAETMRALRRALLGIFPLLLAAQQTDLVKELRFRQIGPFRGGRSVAVAGVPSQPDTYYFGAVGGGVFKTTDSGLSWLPV